MEVNIVKHFIKTPKRIRVAAYVRVSSGKDTMLHSLAAQTSYYNDLIQANKSWIFVTVFSDEAISGTKDDRNGFKAMVQACTEGKIDMIITKSISRFARNTVTLIKTCRELKDLGVDVYFEEQNLHSTSGDGELILTLLASHAQEEAKSVSENIKWRIENCFKEGRISSMTILGYRIKNGALEIDEKEAQIVRTIFSLYLSGLGCKSICNVLNSKGYKTRNGNDFQYISVFTILRNRTYTGDLLLQKTYRSDYLTKKTIRNKGEMQMYLVSEAHEPIITKEMFELVQQEITRRQSKTPNSYKKETHLFSKIIVCEHCGRHFIRSKSRDNYFWRCTTYEKLGKSACPSQKVPEKELIRITSEVLNSDELDESLIKNRISKIEASDNHVLTYYLKTGTEIKRTWVAKRKEHKICVK